MLLGLFFPYAVGKCISSTFLQLPIFNFLLYLYLSSLPPQNKNNHPWAFFTLSLTVYANEFNSYISCPLLACLRLIHATAYSYLHPEIATDTSNSKCQNKYNFFSHPLYFLLYLLSPVNGIIICPVAQARKMAFGIPLPLIPIHLSS